MPDLARISASRVAPPVPEGPSRVTAAPGNRLLAALAQEAEFETVTLPPGAPLVSAGQELRFCHFLDSGLVSVVKRLGARRQVEVCVVGRDGMLGLPAVYGITRVRHEAVALTPCRTRRIATPRFMALLAADEDFRRQMLRYAYARMAEAMQIAACHSSHALRARLARWLLLADERLGGEALEITHAALAALFSVRRAGITQSLHVLEGEGAVRSTRRRLELRDRRRLAALSCGCETAVRQEFARVF
jgi:CRP-like cAMP-binding protein